MLIPMKYDMDFLSLVRSLLLILLCTIPHTAYTVDFGRIQPDEVAYYVQDLQTGEVLAQHQENTPMSPASTMKLVTSFAAFTVLGKDYQWITSWSSDAPIHNGNLLGDLYWKGTNDPVFDQKDLTSMQIQLIEKGIYNIQGNLVLDKSLQKEVNTSHGFDKDKNKSFTTPPDPHNLAYKVVWLYYYLNSQNQPTIGINPPLPSNMTNIQVTSNPTIKDCASISSYLYTKWDGQQLNIKGNIPPSCVGESAYINIFDINQFVKYSFISHWQKLGNIGPKDVLIGHEPIITKILAINYSPKLSHIIKNMNKYSNNLIARSIFLEIGKKTNLPSAQAITRTLQKADISTEHFFIENGSGLSRVSQVTTKMLGQILYASYFSSFKYEFIDSLPIAGIDGTLKRRLKTMPNLHLKTGNLDNVHALAGYKLPSQNHEHPISIAIIVNKKHNTNLINGDLDQLLVSILKDVSEQHNMQAPQSLK
ncbi:MAG: D-alanyl-D-alanine carboxypeptidase/D-alanyl-D-alanine-endopeptidase [Neisseriaceae bacterium]|nr:MAG: D-alanyl-D-alanine carboxypeptidase/D-alanyl-D-alanine-endopeptidase [Neisseriaceae bacterium]